MGKDVSTTVLTVQLSLELLSIRYVCKAQELVAFHSKNTTVFGLAEGSLYVLPASSTACSAS